MPHREIDGHLVRRDDLWVGIPQRRSVRLHRSVRLFPQTIPQIIAGLGRLKANGYKRPFSRNVPTRQRLMCTTAVAGEYQRTGRLAEGVGFEPTIRFPVYTLSKRAPSATRPSLRARETCNIATRFRVTTRAARPAGDLRFGSAACLPAGAARQNAPANYKSGPAQPARQVI
jgi:hypothetical protein